MKRITKRILAIILAVSSLLVVTSCPEPHVHTWDNGRVTRPNCLQDGEITYTCTECGETKTETVHALGHHVDRAYNPDEWLVDTVSFPGSNIQYTHCPSCGEVVHFGENFEEFFEINKKGETLVKNDKKSVLPAEIKIPTILNGKMVTIIGQNAFNGESELKKVEIPLSVTTINFGAFYECTSLTSLTIPDSVTTIGRLHFQDVQILRGLLSLLQCQVSLPQYLLNVII